MLFHLFVVSAFCVIFNWGLIANVQANIFTGDCYLQFNKMTMIVQFKKKYFYTGKNAFVFASSENLTVTIYYETLFLRLKISISCFFSILMQIILLLCVNLCFYLGAVCPTQQNI